MNDETLRNELISCCQDAVVPEANWRNRDSASAQRQVGEALALLRSGCPFALSDSPSTDDETWWVDITFRGFQTFELGEDEVTEVDLFYIPTRQRLDEAAGRDWY